jgi:flagella basal body P-ring formation protein FlgA
MMNHPRPTSLRKTIQLMVVLTLLAWATQTLFKQWGYGAVIVASGNADLTAAPASRGAAIIELRDRINTDADVVTLKDVCRWSDRDASALGSFKDIVLARLGNAAGVKKVTASDVRAALHDAGANLPMIQISGAAGCAVVKGAVSEDQIALAMSPDSVDPSPAETPDAAPAVVAVRDGSKALPVEKIVEKVPRQVPPPQPSPGLPGEGVKDQADAGTLAVERVPHTPGEGVRNQADAGTLAVESSPHAPGEGVNTPKNQVNPADSASAPAPELAEAPQTSLKDLLVNDLTARLGLRQNQLQLEFDPRDQRTLALTAPRLTFQIDSSRAAGLGAVSWTINIRNGSSERTATVSARASAWEDQVVLTRSLSSGQMIQKSDVTLRHALVEKLTPGKILDPSDAIGEVASSAMERGDVLSENAVRAASIVQAGDFVTVAMDIDSMKIETVARALDSGPKGGIIRAKNEATGQVYQVSVTGPGTGYVTQTIGGQDVASINPGS